VIAQWSDENLCLMLQASEGFGMDDAVTVTLKTGSYGAWLFPSYPATTEFAFSCKRREIFFSLLRSLAYTKLINHQNLIYKIFSDFK
jgi:hypothetical protein